MTVCIRIKRVFDTVLTDKDESEYIKIFERWEGKEFRMEKLRTREQESLIRIMQAYPLPVLKKWTKKYLMTRIKTNSSEDTFRTLLGRLGVDLTEEDAVVLDEALRDDTPARSQTQHEINNDKLEFQASIAIHKGSIQLSPAKRSKPFTIVTQYKGLVASLSKSSKFLWFELDLQDATCMINKHFSNLKYEFVKKVNSESEQKLVSLIFEKPLNTLPNQASEKLQIYVDPLAFVFYPDVFKELKKDFQFESMEELKILGSLKKLNNFATASKVLINIFNVKCLLRNFRMDSERY